MLLLILVGFSPLTDLLTRWASPWVVEAVARFSVLTHYDGFQRGVLDSRDLVYFLSVMAFSLFATGVILRNHRAGRRMQKKHENLLYSAGGLAAVFIILVLVNVIVGAGRVRLDFTQGKLYTLSQGTRSVLDKLPGTVRLRLYFTQGDNTVPLGIKAYGRRVEDMLAEFRQAAHGNLSIEKFDPQPDSDAEDAATLEGVDAQTTPGGDKFYLGLSVSYADQKLALPALTPDREPLLEYDLTRAIARATTTTKPVIGVMSALPVFGMGPNPMTGGQPVEQQVFIGELKHDYAVKRVGLDPDRIDDDIKVLVVIHPRGISEHAQYALDQFVLRGGKLIAFLDPNAYFDPMGGMMNGGEGGTQSSLDRLLKAWGIGFDTGKVVMDMRYLTGAGTRSLPTLLSLNDNAFDPDDVSTARLGSLLMPFAGVFTGKPAQGLTETVLMKTSTYSQLVDSFTAATLGEAAIRNFQPSGTEYPLAIRLTGKFRTAFPKERPRPKRRATGRRRPSPPLPHPRPRFQWRSSRKPRGKIRSCSSATAISSTTALRCRSRRSSGKRS